MNLFSRTKHNPLFQNRTAWSLAIYITLAVVATTATLVGCGGSHDGISSATSGTQDTATGRAKIIFQFPKTTSRLVPVAANSIVVRFLKDGAVVASQTVARPASGTTATASFDKLPVGSLIVDATAYPSNDGTGVAQATASTTATIVAGETASTHITMGTTIDHLAINPANPSVTIGSTVALTATAIDASGNVVLTLPATISWSSQNTEVAKVDSSGTVSGIASGIAVIQAAESESGKTATVSVTVGAATPSPSPSPSSSPSPSPTPSVSPSPSPTPPTGTTIVDLANIYIYTLSDAQKAATAKADTAANAAHWSSQQATPDSDGTNALRNGVAYSSLNDQQKAAWNALVNAVLANDTTHGPLNIGEYRNSEKYLASHGASGVSQDYLYVGIVGTPSYSGGWMLQLNGRHIAHNYHYTGNKLDTTTPYFIGAEPILFDSGDGQGHTPLADQQFVMYGVFNSLTSSQLAAAYLAPTFSDVLLGEGKDARNLFPTGTTGRGLLCSNLTADQKIQLRLALTSWDQNLGTAHSPYLDLYIAEMDQTYIAYHGSTSVRSIGDYYRIDGPHVWIEFYCGRGEKTNELHFHTVWRDRVSDYNAAYNF